MKKTIEKTDLIVSLGEQTFGKPRCQNERKRMLCGTRMSVEYAVSGIVKRREDEEQREIRL